MEHVINKIVGGSFGVSSTGLFGQYERRFEVSHKHICGQSQADRLTNWLTNDAAVNMRQLSRLRNPIGNEIVSLVLFTCLSLILVLSCQSRVPRHAYSSIVPDQQGPVAND